MQQQQRSATMIDVSRIRVIEGHNPRTYFDTTGFNRLVDSIRTDGVITAITVRRTDDEGYELIAGERRLRAVREVGLTEIPATVVDVDDLAAKRMALTENLDRRDLTIPEEARAARQFVDACDGDQAAAARALGWTPAKLTHRLLLLHATDAVMDALMREQIAVGHAELLASLPPERQDAALPKIVENNLTIQQVKEQIGSITLPLSQAKFDQTDCRLCPHNSSVQSSFFSESVGEGRCSSKACFTTKTREWVDRRKAELKEEFGSVALLTEKEPGSTPALLASGANAVGHQTLMSCKGCQHYGAVLDDRLGATTGAVAAPTCFSLSCHSQKVQAYAESLKPAPVESEQDQGDEPGSSTVVPASASAPVKAPAKKPVVDAPRATPVAVTDQYDRVLRDTTVDRLSAGAVEPILALAVYGIAALTAQCASTGFNEVLGALGIKGGSGYKHTDVVVSLAQMDKAKLQGLLQQSAIELFTTRTDVIHGRDEKVSRKQLAGALCHNAGWDLQPHVRVDKDYLAAHTKAALEVVLIESGFKDFYSSGDGGDKKYRALLGLKKPELIDAVLAAGHDFSSYLPEALRKHQVDLVLATKR